MKHDRRCWNDYNMLLACVAALRSPDPNTQVGAYICDVHNRPISNGYNGTPRGIDPEDIPWDRKNEDPLKTKYPYIAHAEKNAILNSISPVTGANLFVTMYPCSGCAIDIIQAGIVSVTYLNNPYATEWQTQAAAWMFKKANIYVHQHEWVSSRVKDILDQLTLLPGG